MFLLLAWAFATLLFSEDLSGLVRKRIPLAANAPRAASELRVITLNCAGQVAAAQEVWAWKPDVVLLQESPASNDLARLAKEWFGPDGNFIFGWDCSIVARGQLTAPPGPKPVRFVHGTLRLGRGPEVEVVSLRLEPPETGLAFWSASCWRDHLRNRQRRREQLQQVLAQLDPAHPAAPRIVGGDFNAPAGDAVFRLLKGTVKECFREAGVGWGNTALNSFPVSRPDQIWINPASHPVGVWARRTRHSDHRMVICDVVLR